MDKNLLHASWDALVSGLLAWLLTYAVHSTLLLGAVSLLTMRGWLRSSLLKERLWKAALVGGLLTASFQVLSGWQPIAGRFELSRLGGGTFSSLVRLPSGSPPGSASSADAGRGSAVQLASGHVIISNSSAHITGNPSGFEIKPSEGQSRTPTVSITDPDQRQPSYAVYYTKPSWVNWALGMWVAIASLLAVYWGLARWKWMTSLRSRQPVEGPLRERLNALCDAAGLRQVKLTYSAHLTVPIALQWSEICLPARALTELEADQQESMLAHELGHLARHDPLWLIAYTILETIFFFQPLNYLARRRLQEEAEYLCDDWAVAHTGSGLNLAKCLAEVAEWIQARAQSSTVSGIGISSMIDRNSTLVLRVQRLLEEPPRPQSKSRRAVTILIAASLLLSVGWAAPTITANWKLPRTTFSNGVGHIRINVPANGDPVLILPEK